MIRSKLIPHIFRRLHPVRCLQRLGRCALDECGRVQTGCELFPLSRAVLCRRWG